MYIHTCIYAHIYMYMEISTEIYVYMYSYIYIYIYIHIYTCIYIYRSICVKTSMTEMDSLRIDVQYAFINIHICILYKCI
jgi:hypothetical protein